MTLTVTLPWPDKRLTPNAKRRKHWRTYQPAIKAERESAHMLTLMRVDATRRAFLTQGGEPIPLTIRFIPPDRRHRDDDGMIGSFKHARDGIADALHVDDRRFKPAYEFGEPEKPGRVEVSIGAV